MSARPAPWRPEPAARILVTGDRGVRLRNVVIHEIAHQWFGNAVTESDWNDVWLSEGFATYFTLLFIEHTYGRDEFVAGLESSAQRVFDQYAEDPAYRIVHADLDDMSRVTSRATYQKGSWVLHMLRNEVGDEAFWSGIRSYYSRFMNSNATTTDFSRAMEEASGLDLERFFDQWLYSGGNPRLEGSWEYDPGAGTLLVDLNQAQSVGPTYDLTMDLEVCFEDVSIPTTVVSVELDRRQHRFVIPLTGTPSEVVLDPGTRVLFEADFGPRDR